jgi:N-methylhydantoinase A
MLAVHSIGAGGGSIVRNGPGGLTVGPQSAGSEPGPACYGRGGTAPTITDANAVLGYLNPETRLGERISLDIEAARRAIAPIAQSLKLSLEETALGIVKVANATMARALRRVTVERGIDGRDCTLACLWRRRSRCMRRDWQISTASVRSWCPTHRAPFPRLAV